MTTREQPDKSEVVRFLLDNEGRVMLCLDATHAGVAVPRRFAMDRGLRLILNSRMPQEIHIGPHTIESELRFGGTPHYCIIPYEALWGAFNPDTGHGMFWPEAMPLEIREGFDAHGMETPPGLRLAGSGTGRKTTPDESQPTRLVHKPRLQVIDGGRDDDQTDAAAAQPEPAKPTTPSSRKPNLRLVE